MRKFLSIFAAMLVAVAVNAEPVILPAVLDVSNVSFRSEGMPDFVVEEGDYAGTYFDMGAHDSSNDTLLYAEWDVTIEPILYNVAVDVYNTNSWRVQLYLLNQAGDTLKDLRYKGSSGQCGQFAIGAMDLRDLEAGDYKLRARAATAWSAMKLKDVIMEADYQGVTVALPGTLLPAYAELSENASVTNNAIAFKPSTAPDEFAIWNVSIAEAGNYNVTIDFTASNGHTYGVALLSADGETQIGAVAEAQSWDTGVKEIGVIEVPAAGNYIVKLTNATKWSEAVLNSITFVNPAAPKTIYLKPGIWTEDNAQFAVYAFQDGEPEYFSEIMELAENETEIYATTIPGNYYNVVFMRLNDGADHVAWDQIWNQTIDLVVPDDKDMFSITAWKQSEEVDKSIGEWSKYGEEEPEPVIPYMAIIGDMNGWDGAQNELVLAEDKKTASATIYLDMNENSGYGFKVLIDAEAYCIEPGVGEGWYSFHRGWTSVSGIDHVATPAEAFWLQIDVAGDYVFTWTLDEKKLEITFPAEPQPVVAIAGSMNSWNVEADIMTPAEDNETASVILSLEAQDYEFKIVVAGQWRCFPGQIYEFHRDWTSVGDITEEGGMDDNFKIKCDVAGDYLFTWTYATNAISITFPEKGETTAVGNIEASQVVKAMENGQIVIIKDGVKYNALGTMVK